MRMSTPTQIATLPPLRLVNRRTHEHAGPCPFCGGDHRSDRFHVWLEPGNARYWCRQCDAKGPLAALTGDDWKPPALRPRTRRGASATRADANPAHIAHYRELYTAVALWAYDNLHQEHNPEPLAYLGQRGLDATSIGAALLGYGLHDPQALPTYLRREHPDLLPYAEAAGLLWRADGALLTHPNLRGAILVPYLAEGQVVDLRSRTFPGKGYRSLAGGYTERGAVFPFGWDSIDDVATVIITEGEFKALAVTQAYRDGRLSVPALAHPGLSYWRDEWSAALVDRGVRTVILAYDSQPRPQKDGVTQLAPEEIWTVRHGLKLAAAGLDVRVLRLPLDDDQHKDDLDAFLLAEGPAALERLLCATPSLSDYQASLPRPLLQRAKLPSGIDYPSHRARPRRLADEELTTCLPTTTLDYARAAIPARVQQHVEQSQGMLVLAHPPGVGKGHGTTAGLRSYLQAAETPGQIVWTALRKNQLHDQQGLDLIPLSGRNANNCYKISEAQVLARKGYPVLASLCQRRCPHVNHCAYLRQFGIDADRFAPQPLLQATKWWQDAGVIVLDEFDPGQLARIVSLDSRNLAAMSRASDEPQAQTVLRWLSAVLAESGGCSLRGSTLLAALDRQALRDQQHLPRTLQAAIDQLPSEDEQAQLRTLPHGATIADYHALPPGHLPTLLQQLAREERLQLGGQLFTSRLEVRDGELTLLLRHDHLIAQLARPDQPKILLDATVNTTLLHALFPGTPIQLEQPPIRVPCTVTQVLRSDWAKSTLHGARRTAWYDAVAQHIRSDRPTLVVCTQGCEADLRAALAARGHGQVAVSHYGGLRGSNQYKGHDVILAQIYHPNLEGILHEGRALFAGDGAPLNERTVTEERTLRSTNGETWAISVITFADPRLAALLERQREAEMAQCALRGRPFDHPEVQISLLFSLPLPGLAPTIITDHTPSPTSNGGRQATAALRLIASAQRLLQSGYRSLNVEAIAHDAGASVVTVRTHWLTVAQALHLQCSSEYIQMPGKRTYQRSVLIPTAQAAPQSTDQADNKESLMCLIRADPPTVARSCDQALDFSTPVLALPDEVCMESSTGMYPDNIPASEPPCNAAEPLAQPDLTAGSASCTQPVNLQRAACPIGITQQHGQRSAVETICQSTLPSLLPRGSGWAHTRRGCEKAPHLPHTVLLHERSVPDHAGRADEHN